jgi:hypothetical protein
MTKQTKLTVVFCPCPLLKDIIPLLPLLDTPSSPYGSVLLFTPS